MKQQDKKTYTYYQSKINSETEAKPSHEHAPLTQYHHKMYSQNQVQGRSRSAERRRTQKFYHEYNNNMTREQQKENDGSVGLVVFIIVLIVAIFGFIVGGVDGSMSALKSIAR